MMEENICPVCGNPTTRRSRKYCSVQCNALSRRKRVEVQCCKCAEPFELRPYEANRSSSHYCQNCRSHWTQRVVSPVEQTGYDLECFTCGMPVYRPLWRSRRYVYTFCSLDCRTEGWENMMRAWEALK